MKKLCPTGNLPDLEKGIIIYMKLYSFDVFDTLITRSTATPRGIFAIMQKLLEERQFGEINQYVRDNFYELRTGAEQVARNTVCRKGIEDVTLKQIYDVLVRENQITEEQAELLQELEEETELKHICGIRQNIEKVKALIEAKERVILISDMYLNRDTIRRLLVKTDDIFADIPLYVSSEDEKKNKYSGNLFKYVREKEQVEYENWRHMGDNEHSDYKIPEKLGIICEKYGAERLLEIEKEYLKNNEEDAAAQLAAGCAKMARLSGIQSDAYRLGSSIGGAVLYPYVDWLLADCRKNGIKRLYFIARDGFALKELADGLTGEDNCDLETKYIYGSRMAWRIPEEENLVEEIQRMYKHSYQKRIFCVEDLADFFQITTEELSGYIPEKLRSSDKVWQVSTVDFLIERLLLFPEFISFLKAVYRKKRMVLIKYLKQEIDTSDDKFAFIDLAGSGYTQECLAMTMRTYYKGEIHNYFYRKDTSKDSICKNHVFYPNYVTYFVLWEMMCRAPHGQTTGYRENGEGKVIPVLSKVEEDAANYQKICEFIEGIKAFGRIMNKFSYGNKTFTVKDRMISFYMKYIHHTPDKMVLEYFAGMPNMLTGREKKMVAYAPKLTAKDIKNIYWYRENEAAEYYYNGSDLSYSLKRCSDRQLQKIRQYQALRDTTYGKLCRKIHRLFYRKVKLNAITVYDFLGKDIVLYGAGKRGQEFYRQIAEHKKINGTGYSCRITAWVDQNYKKYREQGLMVSAPEELKSAEFDQVVIAVAREDISESIKEMLMKLGIEEYKILWLYRRI